MSDFIRGDRRVIVFSAHAADFCSRAGGTIARLTDAGSKVHIVDFSYGEKCESPALWARNPTPTLTEIKQIRAAEMDAATAILAMVKADEEDPVERQKGVSSAKVQLFSGGDFVVKQATQLHGGIGVTDEHDIGLYFKRMHTLNTLFGDCDYHTERYATLPTFTKNLRELGAN